MSLKSILKPPESLAVGLAEAGAVYAIYAASLPNHADIRSAPAHNTDVESARKQAAWKSAAVLGFVFLMSRDINSFFIGGLALAGIDYMTKHSNGINPTTGKLSVAPPAGAQISIAGDNSAAYPLPDYADSGELNYAG